jgi:hypothetical protein
MIKKISKWALMVVALLVGIGFLLPGISKVEKTIDIARPANIPFEQANDMKNWRNWSAWHQMDPNTVYTFSEPSTANAGAYYTWESPKLGKGKMMITDNKPYEQIQYKMNIEGMGESSVLFKFTALDSLHTKVNWLLTQDHGLSPFSRWFGLFMNQFIGSDFEKGLSNMKFFCESR